MKKTIAWLLSLCLMLGMITPALAAAPESAAKLGSRSPASVSAQAETGRGFLSQRFRSENTHQFQKDDRVRAIVIMESAPLADTQYSIASADASAYTARLQREKNNIYRTMRANKVDYELVYTFDTLLNGFSCDVAYGDLETIAKLPGVQSVHIANVYSIPTPQEPNMAVANGTTKINSVHTGGYEGQGMVVAVLDSGTYLEHDAFQDYGNLGSPALTEAKVNTAIQNETVEAGQYISAKVPFAYDYADKDNDPTDDGADTGGHGTHVAGIAVGYAEDDSGEVVTFSGAAPKAQLLAMKIFGSKQSTTSSDVYFKALEDAMTLGADVINMSIGSDSGFTYDSELEDDITGNIYERLKEAGIVVCISNGNSSSMGEYATRGYISPDYTDYGTAGSPASYTGNVAVGSMENEAYPQFIIKVGGRRSGVTLTYSDTSDDGLWVKTFGGKDVEYVLLVDADGKYTTKNGGNGLCIGAAEDYTDAVKEQIEGKIVVVSRGDSTFTEKVEAASVAGAAGVVVVNNQAGIINMSVEKFYIPAISIELSDLVKLRSTETEHTLYTNRNSAVLPSSVAGEMSDFSSWGTTPDLTLRPILTSVGGNIYSADWKNACGYTLMSGTSMSSPNLAGTFACLLSYLYSKDSSMDKEDAAEAAKLLMESSAQLIEDPEHQLYSVRKQGTGLARADQAIKAWESGYVTEPIHELGDNKTGTYSFTVKVKNNSEESITYNTSIVVMTDSAEALTNQQGQVVDYRNTLQSTYLYDSREDADEQGLATVTMDPTVTVAAGAEASVAVTVTLTDAGKAYFTSNGFDNGSFVEGYVLFTAQGAVDGQSDDGDEDQQDDTPAVPTIHATFLGYFGDWTQAPVLEGADFQDYLEAEYFVNTTVADAAGHTYADYGYTPYDLLDVYTDVNWAYLLHSNFRNINYLGGNILSGYDNLDQNGQGNRIEPKYAPYSPEHNMLSTNDEATPYNYLYVNPYQLRNASFMEMVVTNADDSSIVYHKSNPNPDLLEDDYDSTYVPKAVYSSSAQRWVSYTEMVWDGTDAHGDPLPDGTKVHVTLNATLPYGEDSVQEDCWKILEDYDEQGNPVYRSGFEVTMDSTAPVVETSFAYGETEEDDGTLTVTVTDMAPAAVFLYAGSLLDDIQDYILFDDDEAVDNGDGTVTQTVQFSIPSWWGAFYGIDRVELGVIDYATNETDVVALLLDNIGEEATVTLVSPQGEQTIETTVGTDLLFPDCTDATAKGEDAEFMFWCDTYIEEPVPFNQHGANPGFYNTYGYTNWVTPGDTFLVTGDITFYAVYMVGKMTVLDQPLYTAYAVDDYTGDWAIVGQPYAPPAGGGSAGLRYDDPYVLNADGTTKRLKTLDPDVDLSTADYNEFYSDAEGIRFTFTPVEDADMTYTIKNTATGKYLADEDGEIAMVDSAENDNALWVVEDADFGRPISLITNVDSGLFLLFDDDANPYTFRLMDAEEDAITVGGTTYLPTDAYYTFLYRCYDAELLNTILTPDVKPYVAPSPSFGPGGFIPQPSNPSEPDTEIKDNGDGTTTTVVTDKETGTVTETTEKKDGTVEVVETKTDGTVTETVTAPDGSKTETVTDSDNAVTITATNAEGEVLAKVEIPAEIPELDEEQKFVDVPDDHFAAEAINQMAAMGVIKGVGNNEFDRDGSMKRGDLALMLSRLSNAGEGYELTFSDVPATMYYANGVAWAAETGVVTGRSEDTFDPEKTITREELALMLYRYAKLLNMDTETSEDALNAFTDGSDTNDWAEEGVAWCVDNGILRGKGDNILDPRTDVTRAEVAVMLKRFIGLIK